MKLIKRLKAFIIAFVGRRVSFFNYKYYSDKDQPKNSLPIIEVNIPYDFISYWIDYYRPYLNQRQASYREGYLPKGQ